MATIATLGLLVFSTIGTLSAAPTNYHDQRQSGEYNLHTRLDNFIVVLIPKTNFFDSTWIDYVKRINLQDHLKHVKKEKPKPHEVLDDVEDDEDEEEERWLAPPEILSKNPYTVDVEIKSQPSPLSRLHPSPVVDISSDVMVALSPSVALSKSPGTSIRSSKPPKLETEFIRSTSKRPQTSEKIDYTTENPARPSTLPREEPKITTTSTRVPEAPEEATEAVLPPLEVKPLEEPARLVKKSKSIISTTLERVQKAPKATDNDKQSEKDKEWLKRVAAAMDVCKPSEKRAEDGNCVPINSRQRSSQYHTTSDLLTILRFGLSPANE